MTKVPGGFIIKESCGNQPRCYLEEGKELPYREYSKERYEKKKLLNDFIFSICFLHVPKLYIYLYMCMYRWNIFFGFLNFLKKFLFDYSLNFISIYSF